MDYDLTEEISDYFYTTKIEHKSHSNITLDPNEGKENLYLKVALANRKLQEDQLEFHDTQLELQQFKSNIIVRVLRKLKII